jgi:hypothetical protein
MTCAGLIGLAVHHGSRLQKVKLKGGLDLGGQPKEDKPKEDKPNPGRAGAKPPTPPAAHDPKNDPWIAAGMNVLGQFVNAGVVNNEDLRGNLYFLWSLERVGMVYGRTNIGNRDWHQWGADYLLRTQQQDGHWDDKSSHSIDAQVGTALALLFLNRVNVANDLTTVLRGANSPAGPKPAAGTPAGNNVAGATPKPMPDVPPVKPAVEAPAAPTDAQEAMIDKLGAQLTSAPAARQAQLIEEYKGGEGVVYTEALARNIPKMTGEAQKQARRALRDRLAGMSAATLRKKLQDLNPEIRRAAALASATERELIPDLIATVTDDDPAVARAAGLALQALTRQDLGPPASSTASERTRAQRYWQQWWDKNKNQ